MTDLLTITGPVYLLIALGFVAVRSGWMAAADMRVLGRFVAQVCIPALLLRTLTHLRFEEVLHGDFLLAYTAGSLAAWGAVLLLSWRLRGRSLSLSAIHGLGAANSNSAFIGYPIVLQVLGPIAGLGLALVQLVENLLVIPLSLMLAESQGGERNPLQALRQTAQGIVRNPMIIANAIGLSITALGLPVPGVVDKAVSLLAAAAPPVALFVIGGSLVGLKLDGLRSDIALVASGKLLLHPLCVGLALALLPPADPGLRAVALLFASMPMLSIYPVLAQRQGHQGFCAAALLVTTLASFVTVNAVIALLPPGWRLH